MLSKSVLCLFLMELIFKFTQGQNNNDVKFRNDYNYELEPNSFYKIYTLPRTRDKAKAICEREGTTLFYPEDETEVMSVTEYWNKTQPYLKWVIVDMNITNFKTTEGATKDGYYANWQPGEPNNLDGEENCIAIGISGALNDVNCNSKYPFICKKTNKSLFWNSECGMPYPGYKFDNVLGKCYKLHSTPRNWTDAYATCYGEEAYLAVIDDAAEAKHLTNYISKTGKTVSSDTGIHLGFFNRDGWITIKGIPLHESGYKTWAQSEPNGGISEDCGAMTSDGLLRDVSCNQKMFFICEYDVLPALKDIFS